MSRKMMMGLITGGLLALGLLVYGLFQLPYWAVLTWAILTTGLLPVLTWGGWALGRYEATAMLKGIDAGVDRVAGAAVRLHTREARPVNVAVLPQLPMPQVTQRQLSAGESGVIEL